MHHVLRDEDDIACGEHFLLFTYPLFHRSTADKNHLLLVRMAMEVVALPGFDENVEHTNIRRFGHVLWADYPSELSPIEFFPLDIIDAYKTHVTLSLFLERIFRT